MKSVLPFVFLASVLAALVAASPSTASEWTADDILLAEGAGGFQISPDGKKVVWLKRQMDAEKGQRKANLMLSFLDGGGELQLTRGAMNIRSPRWSPDGRWISFVSAHEDPGASDEEKVEGPQIWLVDPRGGAPWRLTQRKRSPQGYAWLNAQTLIFSAEEEASLVEALVEEKEDTSRVVEDAEQTALVRLFTLEVKDGKAGDTRRLTTNEDWIENFAASPDGRWVVSRHRQSLSYDYDERVRPKTFLTNLKTGERREIFSDGVVIPNGFVWSPDSSGFFVVNPFTNHPRYRVATISQLWYFDLSSRTAEQVDLGWERGLGYGGQIRATRDGCIALLADGVRFKPAQFRRAGSSWKRSWIEGEHADNLFDWEIDPKTSTLVYETSTTTQPPQWYRSRLDGARIKSPSQITRLNPGWADKTVYKTEIVHWTGARDEQVEGILYFPIPYEPGKRYPLVLSIHGGPAAADLDAWDQSWAYPKLLIAQKGAFQLEVNYHGSANYGLEWVESIGGGKYYELEIPDLEKGVDAMIARGLVDPDKLATFGWSNGGILSAELITRTQRYKAASIGAADVEWISDWGNVAFGASFDNYYFGASPIEDPELYVEKSPFFRLGEVTTPTLVFTGTEDVNVPPSQSWSLFRALQQLGNTEVRFVLFPGEPHGLRKLIHQRRKIAEDLAFLDRHLFQRPDEKNPSLKEGSPLAQALALAKAGRVDGLYGVSTAGVLAPETVEYQGLRVGRFEVTQAQYAASQSEAEVPASNGNLPAAGLTYEEAQSYVRWLSEKTGKTYRLPTKAEADKLYGSPAGNTLDRWAGYRPNPADAARLLAATAELGEGAPLLQPVGSHPGKGKDPVFDLGGNVGEWTTEGSSGRIRGGSADRSSDPTAESEAGPAYRGLRVIQASP